MKQLHEMTNGEIVEMLSRPNQRVPPRIRQFLAELLESYEPSEVPDVLRTLSRAAEALKDKPADFDLMSLSFRELGPIIGYGDELPEIPGVDSTLYDVPLREMDAKIGPFELRYHAEQLSKKLDAENGAALSEFAQRYAFPPP